jgi:hypothetical protein
LRPFSSCFIVPPYDGRAVFLLLGCDPGTIVRGRVDKPGRLTEHCDDGAADADDLRCQIVIGLFADVAEASVGGSANSSLPLKVLRLALRRYAATLAKMYWLSASGKYI